MIQQTLFPRLLCTLTVTLSLALGSALAAQETPKLPEASKAPLPGMGTTKGPFAPGIQPDMLWDGRKLAPFHALDLPKMVKASEADDFIEPSEYILGVTVQGQSRAYPSRFIGWHHIVNDKVTTPNKGDTWFAVTYCSVCNTGIRYDLALNGKPIKLDFYGLYNGVVTLCDRESESVFLHVSGKFINGPLLGKELTPEPLLDTTWGEWKRLHPDTLIMSPDNEYSARYRPKGQPVQRGNTRFGMPYFQASVTRGDKRLPPFEKVLGVTLVKRGADGTETGTVLRRAYPIKALQDAGGVCNDNLGEMPAAVFFDPKTISACAVSRLLDGKTLTFEARKAQDDTVAYYDKETGTRWSIEGKAEEGTLAGKSLERLDAHLSQWYGWFAYFPDTTIYGHTEPPQPGNPFDAPAEKSAPGGVEKKP
ncbi:MAG: uncharacterized protein JWL77_6079 [Chthonomonadaceae bacterium]|nr:uncharacterized protein [Chthonomonadaceae bacterium]